MSPSVHFTLILLTFVSGTSSQSTITVGPDTVKVGGQARLTCTYTLVSGDSLSGLAWAKSDASGNQVGDNVIVSTATPSNERYSLSNDNSLVISNVEVADAGYYLCRISTVKFNAAEDFTNLTVNYLNTPILNPNQNKVKENETATFNCPLPDGNPTPITIRWIKDGNLLDVSDTEKYPQSDTTLEITKVNEMDKGVYQCRAENGAYSGEEGKLSNNGTLELGAGDGGGDGDDDDGLDGGIIALIVIVILLALGVGTVGLLYGTKKACFSQNGIKNVDGSREIEGLTTDNQPSNEITLYAQVKPVNSAPPKPKRAGSTAKNPDANVENITYADLDLKDVNDGKKDQIIRTDPETQYSSVMHNNKKR